MEKINDGRKTVNRANVKPLTHWVIYKKYTVRFRKRTSEEVTGILTTPSGIVEFRYAPQNMVIYLAEERIAINEYGWELHDTPN